MQLAASVGSLAAVGGLVSLLIAWLTSRRLAVARAAGLLIAVIAAGYCAVVVFALVAGTFGDASTKLPGVVATSAFAVTGLLAVLGAFIGCRSRRGTTRATSARSDQ